MSLLESFTLLFETEGLKDIPKDAKEAKKQVDEFSDTTEKAEKENDDFSKSAKEAGKALDKEEKTVTKTDKAVKKLGKTVEKEGIRNVKALAVQLLRSVSPMLFFGKAMAGAMQFVSEANEVAEAAKEAGMSIENFQKKNGEKYAIFTREDVKIAKDYELVMRDVRMGTKSIGAEISRMILPTLLKVTKAVSNVVDFFTKHGTFIKLMFLGIAAAITVAAIPAIVSMGTALWTALAPVIAPALAVIAVITGIALAIDDLITWINGGESAFSDLWEEIFGNAEQAKAVFGQIKKALMDIWNFLKPAFKWLIDNALKVVINMLQKVAQIIGNGILELQEYGETISRVINKIKSFGGGKADVNVNKNVKVNGSHAEGLDYVPFDGYIAELHKGERVQTADEANDWRSGLIAAKQAVNFTSNFPLNAIPSGAISNAYNNSSSSASRSINISGITIQTQATDAQGIAQDFSSYIKQAMISLDDGMLA